MISLRVTNSFIGAGSLLAFARRYCWRAAVGSIGRPLGPNVRANFTVTFAFGLKNDLCKHCCPFVPFFKRKFIDKAFALQRY